MEKLSNVKKMFTLEGIVYTQTNTGYCYKSTNAKDRKGQTINSRIGQKTFNEAYEAYLNASVEWEQEVTTKVEEADKVKKEEDRKAEEQFNKPTRKEVNDAVGRAIDGEIRKDEEERKALKPAVLNEHGLVICTDCPIKDKCIHRDAMRRNPTEVGGLALCPRLAVKEEKKVEKKKAEKKVRRSKDVAFEYSPNGSDTITLTAKQVDFIHHIPDTNFYEHGLESTPWCDVLTDEIGGQFEGKPMTVGAMISTLREKGLIYIGVDRINGKKAKYFGFTDMGKRVAEELGLK